MRGLDICFEVSIFIIIDYFYIIFNLHHEFTDASRCRCYQHPNTQVETMELEEPRTHETSQHNNSLSLLQPQDVARFDQERLNRCPLPVCYLYPLVKGSARL